MNNKLFKFISSSPTPYHAIAEISKNLKAQGFSELNEAEDWVLEKNKSYYVTRNASSIIAFKVPQEVQSFMISASHCDTPAFKIKENSFINENGYVKLSTEKYGGAVCSTWMDRPLAIAGRVIKETASGIETELFDTKNPVAIIPTVAPHLDYNCEYNLAVDMLPIVASDFNKGDILASDLFLYNPQSGYELNEYICAPRLDDLMCTFASLEAFMQATPKQIAVMAVFDNEEVGSSTKQGADSTFLYDVLSRIALGFNMNLLKMLPSSLLASCDNGHGIHPNHPELSDKNHAPKLNGGVVIKYNANQKYTTDGISAALFKRICNKASIPYQEYCNRADKRGGGTLGNISTSHVSINSVDIGLAQLAMHSIYETAGAKDTLHMINALKTFFESSITMTNNGSYTVE